MDRNFGGVIWTNHALDRLGERGIKQGDAWATWRNPQESRKGSISGSWVYHRNYGGTQIEVVAKQNERKEWLILSVWSRPVSESYKKPESLFKLILKRLFH
ncbi:MAG TPA: DUF4258 domain-containing protein [Candidatus Saccharimonadales bacterium]|jgi:hypothetical protein|nr:DUF4258 domain-containing protein [Candidatus Saccharimonadales bacterium]